MNNVQTTNAKSSSKSFNSKSPSKFTSKKTETPASSLSAYDNMVILKKDLYYKSLVNSHSEDVTAKTELAVKEIMYTYRRNWISKRELFIELEALRSGYSCTDLPVKDAIRAIRAKN